MTLASGTRLGVYEVADVIGAGGMGEVYRARDSKLQRDVAIKILPDLFAGDPERLARFEREAQTLASLNHPNIAQIYGVVEQPAGLVMELVDGEDLAARLARENVPLDEALAIARQIAAALEAAHDRGIVHRDLKPANVKLAADGTVKVLDFGLAFSPAAGNPAHSPTLTSPAMLTRAGVVLGTAAYMAPEQARGRTVDRRADIWAFGCVLFEMLSGGQPFGGESVADVMHAILGGDPDWSRLPADTPARVREVLAWCLRRDPAERLKDAGDLRVLLAGASERTGPPPERPVRHAPARRAAALSGWALAAILAALVVGSSGDDVRPVQGRPMRFDLPVAPPADAREQAFGSSLALSPDGMRLVYVAAQGASTALFVRDLETGESRPLPDTADAHSPMFSPDGGSIAFISDDRLRALPLSAPLARDLARASAPASRRLYADWSPSGLIFTDLKRLVRVDPEAGTTSDLAALGEGEAGFLVPRALPGGRQVLLAVRQQGASNTDDPSDIAVVDLATNEHRIVIDHGGSPAVLRDAAAPGAAFLVFAREGRLWAAQWDLERRTISGAPQPVVDNVAMRPNGDGAQFALSATGTLAYMEAASSELVWIDGQGAATPASTLARRFAMPRVSPLGNAIAVEVQGAPHQISRLDLDRDLLEPITQWKEGAHDFAWAADGRAIAFTASTGGTTSVMWMPVDGSQEPVTLLTADASGAPWVADWSRDGRTLAVLRHGTASAGLQIVPLQPGAPPRVTSSPATFARVAEGATSAHLSPDAQWVAWCDCGAGSAGTTVSITRVSDGRRYPIDAGTEPRWSASGRELYYRKGAGMMAVDVALGAEPSFGRPRTLFEGDYLVWGSADYDLGRDGRWLMVRSAASAAGRSLHVRLNWIEELKKLRF